jgi:hypothetical protein
MASVPAVPGSHFLVDKILEGWRGALALQLDGLVGHRRGSPSSGPDSVLLDPRPDSVVAAAYSVVHAVVVLVCGMVEAFEGQFLYSVEPS